MVALKSLHAAHGALWINVARTSCNAAPGILRDRLKDAYGAFPRDLSPPHGLQLFSCWGLLSSELPRSRAPSRKDPVTVLWLQELKMKSRIEPILRKATKCSPMFFGVIPCDRQPTRFKVPALLVCNTAPHDAPGEHWLDVYVGNSSCGKFFDDFGWTASRSI